jgi:hypothetical protein
MKQFKDLKIGDKLSFINTLYEMEVASIEKVDDESSLINIKTENTSYGDETVYSNFVVDKTHYYEKVRFGMITPKDNIEVFYEIFHEGIKTGKKSIANSIKQLLMIN